MHILAIESSEVICYNKRRAFIINQNALHMRLPLANSVHIGRLCHNLRLWHNKRRAFIIAYYTYSIALI
mgnify:FL=1